MNNIKELFESNKKTVFIAGVVLLVMMITLIIANGKSYASLQTNMVSINCPQTAAAGSEIECSISANIANITALSVNANYVLTEGLTYVNNSFVLENGSPWTIYAASANGFAIGSTSGVNGFSTLGKVKFTIPEQAQSNGIYKIELINVEYSDSNYEMIELEDASTEIRILSDINTLDSLSLNGGTINETFNKDVTNYTAVANNETVTINYTKTDENSTVEGDTGTLTLHYGTNNYSITVISETNEEKIYNIGIFRPYEFSTDNYIYNKDNNYIYTKADTDSTTILSNITLPNELSAEIKNNKLVISYSEEELLNINILNINYGSYAVVDNIIYIGNNVQYSDFMNNITLNGVNAKVYDDQNNEVSSGTIHGSYKLIISYNSTSLGEYTFNEEYLELDESLIVDDTNKIIKRQVNGTTVEELTGNISTSGNVTIKNKNGQTLSSTDKLKTGDVVEVKLSSGTYRYTISVLGDINGDGNITVGDVSLLYRKLKGKVTLEEYQVAAGDILNDASIKINDVARLYRFMKGKLSDLEVKS